MVDKEMLSAISELLDEKLEEKLEKKLDEKFDQKLEPVFDRLDGLETELRDNVIPRLDGLEEDMKYVRVVQLENDIIPRLNTIEAYYIDTSKRYMESTDEIGEMRMDISILKSSISLQNKKLDKLLA